jgi:sugar lactone lactonase YvrE
VRTLFTDLSFGESPRWHDGRLWLANWGAGEVIALDGHGNREIMARVPSFNFSIDWLPDGRLLITSGALLLRQELDGSLVTHADLGGLPGPGCNEIVVDGRGNIYVNGPGFNLMTGEPPKPGFVALVSPEGSVRQVADNVAFPNGMAVTPDNSTLILAESYAEKLTAFDIATDGTLSGGRVWAQVNGDHPDGICLDAEGAVWYADVGNKHCRRVREGGQVLQTVELDRGCFACMLGGEDGRTLFMLAAEWRGPAAMTDGARTGQVLAIEAPAPHAGRP